ncbi:hypothetical protein [Yinghuangia aomiensis]|uniref:hypothetical protein n=1 Tax=Yinghuangia aomiensis TaxID=676205 RepID=UPI0031E95CCB
MTTLVVTLVIGSDGHGNAPAASAPAQALPSASRTPALATPAASPSVSTGSASSTTTPARGSGSATPSPSQVSAAAPEIVRWEGSVGLAREISLDELPPGPKGISTITVQGFEFQHGNINQALWPGTEAPSRADCDLRVNTHMNQDFFRVHVGQWICVQTSGGFTARIHITAVAADGNGGEADVTIWE